MSICFAAQGPYVRLRLASGLALLLAGSGLGHAAEGSGYSELRERLLAHPSLQVSDAGAERLRHSAAGALGLPNPGLTLGLNNLPLNDPASFDRYLPSSKSLEVMQRIPSLAGREAQRETLLRRAELTQLERRQTLAQLEQRLITALAERQRIRETLTALGQQLELLDELERWLRGEMAGGGAVYGRFDELDVQRARIRERQVALGGKDRRQQAELQALVEGVPDIPPPTLEPRTWDGDPEALIAVRIAERKAEIARAQVEEKRAAFAPDYAIAAAYQQRESGRNFDGDDWFTIKASVSLPLWSGSNQKPKLAAAEAALTAALAERQRVLREARFEYENARADHRTADELLEALTHRAAKLADLEAANRRRYESGESSLESVIRPAQQRVEVTMEEAEQRARRTIAAARMHALLVEDVQ